SMRANTGWDDGWGRVRTMEHLLRWVAGKVSNVPVPRLGLARAVRPCPEPAPTPRARASVRMLSMARITLRGGFLFMFALALAGCGGGAGEAPDAPGAAGSVPPEAAAADD